MLSKPTLRFVDVGQGAALLMFGRHHVVAVDSGPAGSAEALVRALVEHDVDTVDLWIHTHFDADHVGGITRVLAGSDGEPDTTDDIEVIEAWDRGLDHLPRTDAARVYTSALSSVRHGVEVGTSWTAPDMRLDVVGTPRVPDRQAENTRGLALCVTLDDRRILIPGDLPSEQVLDAALACGPVDVLWVSHHGSRDGTSKAVLDAADPTMLVVSAGFDNGYCHPAADTMAMLEARVVWLTGAAGLHRDDPCGALVDVLSPTHHIVGSDVSIDP